MAQPTPEANRLADVEKRLDLMADSTPEAKRLSDVEKRLDLMQQAFVSINALVLTQRIETLEGEVALIRDAFVTLKEWANVELRELEHSKK
jgi:hypothetical protein